MIEHKIVASDDTTATNLAGRVTGASATFAATNDQGATDAFGSGAVRLSGANHILVLDTPAMTVANSGGVVGVAYNSVGTAILPSPVVGSRVVASVTRVRLELQFANATSGSPFALNATNIGDGKQVVIQVFWTI